MRLKRAALPLAAVLAMTGCSPVNFNVDNILTAPKLTEEQSEIHEALISAVGNNITLKYPRNGANRSAYVIADIDGEDSDEALVFYEYTGTGGENDGLRVNLFDKNSDGKWVSVKEIAGAGTEIDQVIITPMGNGNQIDVLVGYQNIAGDDKTLEIYSYDKGDFTRIGTDTYSVLETFDINSDGFNEIITIQRSTNTDTGIVTAKAALLELQDGEITKGDGIDMCDNVASYVSSKKGYLPDGRQAIYIDGLNASGELQTEIVYFRYSTLQNPMQLRSEKLLPLCTRPSGYYSSDIDDDGIIEIPSSKPMLGYENAVAEEQLLMTTWSVYKDFYNLEARYSGYYAISDGYSMMFPSRWTDKVTVKKDADTGETVFYKYQGDINSEMTELMRIAVASKQESEDYLYEGYELIRSKGQLEYLVKLPTNKREQLILTIDEVQNNFYTVE